MNRHPHASDEPAVLPTRAIEANAEAEDAVPGVAKTRQHRAVGSVVPVDRREPRRVGNRRDPADGTGLYLDPRFEAQRRLGSADAPEAVARAASHSLTVTPGAPRGHAPHGWALIKPGRTLEGIVELVPGGSGTAGPASRIRLLSGRSKPCYNPSFRDGTGSVAPAHSEPGADLPGAASRALPTDRSRLRKHATEMGVGPYST